MTELTARQMAALHFKIPRSGDKLIDAMAVASLRNDFAMNIVTNTVRRPMDPYPEICQRAFDLADEMVKWAENYYPLNEAWPTEEPEEK